jgi:hypothetical protein
MDPIIRIESSPITSIPIDTWSGTCYTPSQPVTFNVISGITNGIYVSYEWYLNNILVSIGSGYTLNNPQQDDNIYVKVLNCSGSGLKIGDWIEDVSFYYNDVIAGVPQTYYVDTLASFNYRIISAVLRCDNQLFDVEIQIDSIPVVWTGAAISIDVTNIINETLAVNSNSVTSNNIVTLVTNGTYDTSTLLQGKLRIVRTL